MNPKSLLPWLLLSCGIAIVSSAPKSQKTQKIQENIITQYTVTLEKHTEHRYLLSENGESTQLYSKSLRETYYHEYCEKLLSGLDSNLEEARYVSNTEIIERESVRDKYRGDLRAVALNPHLGETNEIKMPTEGAFEQTGPLGPLGPLGFLGEIKVPEFLKVPKVKDHHQSELLKALKMEFKGKETEVEGYKSWEQYVVDGSEYVGWVALMLVILFVLWEALWLL
ncbi:hypothetical protein FPQ18DRAFT_303066 [Pyronema domesticum]|nr:hypothetical protein FPQ18DRAFT_303066 [Pyronema domesticum]